MAGISTLIKILAGSVKPDRGRLLWMKSLFRSAVCETRNDLGWAASLLAALIAVLLFETQWTNLRAGLIVLLIGQLGDVAALAVRNVQLSRHTVELEHEVLFIKRLALFDTACQMIGFLALGYAFWIYTRSLWLAIAIGIVYPVISYFGISRRNTIAAIKRLRSQQSNL